MKSLSYEIQGFHDSGYEELSLLKCDIVALINSVVCLMTGPYLLPK
jgi:hypothetical protein